MWISKIQNQVSSMQTVPELGAQKETILLVIILDSNSFVLLKPKKKQFYIIRFVTNINSIARKSSNKFFMKWSRTLFDFLNQKTFQDAMQKGGGRKREQPTSLPQSDLSSYPQLIT